MDPITASPSLLKQANLSLIRTVLKTRETATRAEIVAETGISTTTVRSLLGEMMEKGEIESIGQDASSGGRKAERYRFRPERYHSAVFCISGNQVHALLVDTCGEIADMSILEAADENYEEVIFPFLDELMTKREIRAIGLGVPGIVEGGCYWKKYIDSDEFYKVDIGEQLSEKYGIPVVMENDLNATAIGIGLCYEKEFPNEKMEHINMAYVHFDKDCISAGFIVEGRIVRGCNNYAGELGLIPIGDERLLDQCMAEPMKDIEYTKSVTEILSWICAILNPEYIALGGPQLRRECVSSISSLLSSLLPNQMAAEILYSEDAWYDYRSGMAYLTTNKIFSNVQFVKE